MIASKCHCMEEQCKFPALYTNGTGSGWKGALSRPSSALSHLGCRVFSCAHAISSSCLSDGEFLAPIRKNCWSHEGCSRQSPCVSHMKAPQCWPLAKREQARTGEAEGEKFKHEFSPWTQKIMGQELCAKTLQPGCSCYRCSEGGKALGCRRTQQPVTMETALEVFVSKRSIFIYWQSQFRWSGVRSASAVVGLNP